MDTFTISLLCIQVYSRRSRIDGDKISSISRGVRLESCVRIKTVLIVLIQSGLGHAHILGGSVVIEIRVVATVKVLWVNYM